MLTHTTPAAELSSSLSQPRQVLSAAALAYLDQQSNRAGGVRFLGHLGAIALSGYLWATAPLWLALPALLVCGASLALMFCAMHEG